MSKKIFKLIVGLFSIAIFLVFNTGETKAQKLTAQDVISKHLDSIGSKDLRAQIKNQIIIGETTVNYITQKSGLLPGKIVLVSEGKKNYWGMKFNSPNYPSEKFIFDGNKSSVRIVKNGFRSVLGNFVLSNQNILEESLFGGALASSWALLAEDRKAKISLDGTKKVDGKEAYVLGYSPKGGSDVSIKLYFDKETFHHIRTEYKRISSAGIGQTPDQSSQFSESRISLTEDFSDFKTENGLTFPRKYRVLYSISGQKGTTEVEWLSELKEIGFNQNLDPETFNPSDN